MRARKISENISFQRGIDPKKGIDVGPHKRNIYTIDWINAHGIKKTDPAWIRNFLEESLPNIVGIIPTGILYNDPHNIGKISFVQDTPEGKREFSILYLWRNEAEGIIYKGEYFPFKSNLDESQNFHRGQDPKETMDIGILPEIRKKMVEDGWKYEGPNSILKWASAIEESPEYIKYAIDHGANVQGSPGKFAIQGIIRWNKPDIEIFEYLIRMGADIHCMSYWDFEKFVLYQHPKLAKVIRKYHQGINRILSYSK